MDIDIAQPLQWKWKDAGFLGKEFELLSGGQRIALLKFRSLFGKDAKLSFQEQSWTFKQLDLFAADITIQRTGSDTEEAIFSPSRKLLSLREVGELVLRTGASFPIRRTGFLQNVWHIDSAFGELLDFKVTGALRFDAEIHAGFALHSVSNPLLVIGFTFYLALVHLMNTGE